MKFLLVVIFSFGMLACGSKSTQKSESSKTTAVLSSPEDNLASALLQASSLELTYDGSSFPPISLETLPNIQKDCELHSEKFTKQANEACGVSKPFSANCEGLDDKKCSKKYRNAFISKAKCLYAKEKDVIGQSQPINFFEKHNDLAPFMDGFSDLTSHTRTFATHECGKFRPGFVVQGWYDFKKISDKPAEYVKISQEFLKCHQESLALYCGAALVLRDRVLTLFDNLMEDPKFQKESRSEFEKMKTDLNQPFLPERLNTSLINRGF